MMTTPYHTPPGGCAAKIHSFIAVMGGRERERERRREGEKESF